MSERTRWVLDVKSPKDEPRITLTYMPLESAGDVLFLATGPAKERILAALGRVTRLSPLLD